MRELKRLTEDKKGLSIASHPLRVRELKHEKGLKRTEQIESHPLRVRELKHPVVLEDGRVFGVAPFTGA